MFAILISDLTEWADEGHFRYVWVPTWCDPNVTDFRFSRYDGMTLFDVVGQLLRGKSLTSQNSPGAHAQTRFAFACGDTESLPLGNLAYALCDGQPWKDHLVLGQSGTQAQRRGMTRLKSLKIALVDWIQSSEEHNVKFGGDHVENVKMCQEYFLY